ncbi:MAG: monovalent cation:proton antiporter-2 (CPA2) family protein [Gammaproteobacteria bacterium]|nr:monovalent cation:proton antiporter-2 (CPA2) family protein [Gammaproteobacteria bacterium]MBU2677714.1 monovalent cation:proton antiporter-2 (CPA2) family protein [Gammaproteobacteria bacterium]NNL51447.1 potassium transporter [Woeseiaceae bacterium]
MEYQILAQVLMLLLAAVVILFLFRRLRLPTVLGYLVVGVVVGPIGLGIVPTDDQALLAEFGIVFLLFTLGLEFSWSRVVAMKREVFGLGGMQVALTTLAFGLLASWMGFGPGISVVIGGSLALSSTALVIKQLSDQLELSNPHGRLATGILLFQDIAAVPLLVLVSLLAADGVEYDVLDVPKALLEGALAIIFVLLAGRWLLRPAFREIARTHVPEHFTLAVLLVALGAAWATYAAGLSLALGAFLAGMMLSETEFRHQVEADIRPFRDLLLGLFFITIGMRLDFGFLVRDAELVVGLAAALIAGKAILVTGIARGFADNWRDAARTSLAVAQGGEFGLALITLASGAAIITPAATQAILAALVLSMLISPLIIRTNSDLTSWLASSDATAVALLNREMQATGSLAKRDHVVICGYGRVGQNVARLLQKEGFEFIALDLEPGRVRRARQAGDPVYYGDAAKAEILANIGLPHANAVVISFSDALYAVRVVETVRRFREDVPILVRTRDDAYFDLLQQTGASVIVPESIESSLILSAYAMNVLQVPLPRIIRTIERVRSHRYGELRQIFPKEAARHLDETHAMRERLSSIALPPGAHAVGRTLAELRLADAQVMVNAIRRDGITGRQPLPESELRAGDVVVLFGTPEALERGETILLNG